MPFVPCPRLPRAPCPPTVVLRSRLLPCSPSSGSRSHPRNLACAYGRQSLARTRPCTLLQFAAFSGKVSDQSPACCYFLSSCIGHRFLPVTPSPVQPQALGTLLFLLSHVTSTLSGATARAGQGSIAVSLLHQIGFFSHLPSPWSSAISPPRQSLCTTSQTCGRPVLAQFLCSSPSSWHHHNPCSCFTSCSRSLSGSTCTLVPTPLQPPLLHPG